MLLFPKNRFAPTGTRCLPPGRGHDSDEKRLQKYDGHDFLFGLYYTLLFDETTFLERG